MPTYKELTDKIEVLEGKVNALESKSVEKKIPSIEFQDIKDYDQLKVRVLHAGLPVFKVAPTYTGFQGETVLHDDESSTRGIYTYLNGTWYSATLT